MIYALNTLDVSDHERRVIARQIRDGRSDILGRDRRVVLVRNTKVAEGHYYCVYCMKRVHKWWRNDRIRFDHAKDEGCLGSDKGLPGIVNPRNVTMLGQP
ncbi:MAG: hypothetical protein OXI63_06905 [Candidatus Poribacteria bacterium]|nr:hypothetical protein [Candidatus Poribacteria bacterium]